MHHQNTLSKPVSFTGVGLHSGKNVTITLHPADANTGIVFMRTDLPGAPRVKAEAANVTAALRATTLEAGTAKVFTVEHLLAACSAMNIDNCLIGIDSVEPPVADGSALPFVRLIQSAGIVSQAEQCQILAVKQEYSIREQDRFITILPYDGFRITFTSVNPHPLLGVQFGDYEITQESFLAEIAAARTIGFMHEVEALKAQGLALGGSIENVVVYNETEVLTPLRFADELVRHKILDIIGDLALLGRIHGHIIAVKSSHALNTQLAKKIVERVSENTQQQC